MLSHETYSGLTRNGISLTLSKMDKRDTAFGSIEHMPAHIQEELGPNVAEIREIFLKPDVTDNFDIAFRQPDFDGIIKFLCEERKFSRERVEAALDRAFRQS